MQKEKIFKLEKQFLLELKVKLLQKLFIFYLLSKKIFQNNKIEKIYGFPLVNKN